MFISYWILGNTNELSLSLLGGNTLPETINIYQNNFKEKTLVTDYVWNGDSKITIYEFDEDLNIQYNSDRSTKTYSLKAGEGSRDN